MKTIFPLALCLIFALPTLAQKTKPGEKAAKLDTAAIRHTGADEHGMRNYVFCLLKTGPNKDTAKAPRSEAFKGHFANMGKLSDEGKLLAAGPFDGKEGWRGMFVFNAKKIEEADAWVKTDPAVAAGYLSYELHTLFSSAAIALIPELHKTLQTKEW